MAGLVRAADGTLYGTTYGYGLGGPGIPNSGELGTVFRISADGVVEKLFGGAIQPFGPLLIGDDGDLYGTSYTGPVPLGALFRVRLSTTRLTPMITWPLPGDITYGTPLGPSQLNVTADVPGTFAYTPPAGTVLEPGLARTMNVLFNPADTIRYEPTAASVSINVTAAGTMTTASSQKNPSKFGQPVKITATVATTAAGAGTPTGVVNFFDGSVLLGAVSLNKGKATFSASGLTRGSHTIVMVYSGSTRHQTSTGSLRQQVN